jgi:hypothetical protein
MILPTMEFRNRIRRSGILLTIICLQCILAGCNLPVNQAAAGTSVSTTAGDLETAFPSAKTASEATTPVTKPVAANSEINTSPTITHIPSSSPQTNTSSAPETTETPAVEIPCNRAVAGSPIDVSITDGTVLMPGQPFSKTWRLVNAGSCTWTQDYSVVWFSGSNLAPANRENFNSPVRPGEIVEITVDMLAPSEAGAYQSNWKIEDGNGVMFGLGPNGDSPFWVKINVYIPPTETVAVPASQPTATPSIYASGSMALTLNNEVDLDHGTKNPASGNDFRFSRNDQGERVFIPEEGSRILLFGTQVPNLATCKATVGSVDPVRLSNVGENDYYCYQTSQGLPGYLRFDTRNLAKNQLEIVYSTWDVP